MRAWWCPALALLALGCSGGAEHSGDGGPSGDLAGMPDDGALGSDGGADLAGVVNIAPMIIDDGPPSSGDANVPFVSVTICAPGTSSCQTIDHVIVDTGSSGLRVVAPVLSINLPQPTATTGEPLAECFQFADGYTWGSVRSADVKIAGEVAAGIPIQLIGDPAFTNVPPDCSSAGLPENTVIDLGGNGLLGINQAIPDCGAGCSDSANIATGAYYSCSGASCTAVAVADAQQVANPIAAFARDNNGVILQFPSVPQGGEVSVGGSLIFGIGTAPNNALGAASVLTVDADGNFTTIYKGNTFNTSYIDSGTNSNGFDDSAIPQCTSSLSSGFYCPTSPLSLTAQNQGRNGVSTTVSFIVENTDALFSVDADTVYAGLATPGSDATSFAWGQPFFFGRSVFVALDGAATPGGPGPYFAY